MSWRRKRFERSEATGTKPLPRCKFTHKVAFASHEAALIHAMEVIDTRKRPKGRAPVKEWRAYACSACGQWHLTSKA